MIVRAWRGYAPQDNWRAYADHFQRGVLPELTAIEGFLGAELLKIEEGAETEFLVLTRWSSLAAIRAFAGDDAALAVVEPEAVRALTRFDARVRHYEVVEAPAISSAG